MPLCQTQKRLPLPALEQQCRGRTGESPALVLSEKANSPRRPLWLGQQPALHAGGSVGLEHRGRICLAAVSN